MMKSKNINTLVGFVKYCLTHPTERFWQALRNWSGYAFIYGSNDIEESKNLEDTFYKEGK